MISIRKAKAAYYSPGICRFYGPIDNDGFTLIELIVVMTLIGIIFFFAIPRLDSSLFTNPSRQVSNWIILHVKSLKNRAVSKQTTYVMEIDMGENRISCFAGSDNNISDFSETGTRPEDLAGTQPPDESLSDGLTADEVTEKPKKDDFALPDGYRIADILFADGTIQTASTVEIRFYPRGYSDRAIIHVKDDDGNTMSYIIEPFLSRAIIKDDYVEF